MVRKLKYHEQKLLKKVDFMSWSADNNLHEVKILRRYGIQKRADYTIYNKLACEIRELGRKIKEIDPDHPYRIEQSALLLEKLYMLGLISTKWDLSLTQKVTASSFCRRRLPVVMVRSKMSQTIMIATKLIEQGHVRVGVEVVKDPAFLVTRNLEDFVTWVDTSAIRKHVLEYNNEDYPEYVLELSRDVVRSMGHPEDHQRTSHLGCFWDILRTYSGKHEDVLRTATGRIFRRV
ncbi:U3 small nucleolar ribonucleoprotein protein IMP3 [Harpegnathos saltator]|uniref:U3 small nucleolar ribonucleoprotein protein IMP3 n=1 Tax=Harpegnathos saltator TaxID=610380 RepID=E2BYE3_HARSA|nr:U3 small nucleolar ribonucleoprotein protein IMP3 [Harpegnathos saltator]